ncbi:HNH endonuclease signature motif containing protein [Streptomyces sp. NPDC085466]|uniref:HNH endonuclease signature motif containing protein n=1 Tax=Streptomyces sp. NPDC085466 TaxID=3365725 RepID=UPI0037D2D8A8
MGTSPYTKDRLESAARGARTLTEALERLGVDPKSSTRSYLSARMRKLGVDTSHFEREGVRWTREVLAEAVAASSSVWDVLRRLGVDLVGGQHAHISRRIKAYGIDTTHFTPPTRTERMRRSPRRRTPEEVLVLNTSPHPLRVRGSRLRSALLETGVKQECALCDVGATWRGHPLPLEVDHMDGDWRNNLPGNLRLLCPNCHSATDNYRGRGKGRAR